MMCFECRGIRVLKLTTQDINYASVLYVIQEKSTRTRTKTCKNTELLMQILNQMLSYL